MEKLTLLYAPTTGLMPSYIAKDEGIFEKHGLDVDLVLLPNIGSAMSALVGGTAQIVTPSALAVIQANDGGLDTVFVASSAMSPSASHTGVFVKNGSNLHRAQDLVGRRVGVPSLNTLIHAMTRRWLKEQGVDYSQVNFAEVGFQQMADVLSAGMLDAVYAIEPYYNRVRIADRIADLRDAIVIGLDRIDRVEPYYNRVAEIGYTIGDPDATLPK